MAQQGGWVPPENRPGVLVVGSPNVGKRTLLSRLVSADLSEAADLSSDVICHGWTIDTKYYTADLGMWVADLSEGLSIGSIPMLEQVAALVMVFDMTEPDSFLSLQQWVSAFDIQDYEILLCIGNKADLLPGHFAHGEYRRRLQKHGESSSDPHPEYLDFGISETEGSSLLGDEEPSLEIKRSCIEWCMKYNIEYIEACASNAVFDKCLSVDGDLQGVDRLYGALSAHMWPGMILKPRNEMPESLPVLKEDSSDEESEFEIEYEILSKGSAEPLDNVDEAWDTVDDICDTRNPAISDHVTFQDQDQKHEATVADIAGTSGRPGLELSGAEANTQSKKIETNAEAEDQISTSESVAEVQTTDCDLTTDSAAECKISNAEAPPVNLKIEEEEKEEDVEEESKSNDDMHMNMEDLEQLMCEIGHMRENLRLMPDFQRRERAAKLAMKMAAMFGDSSDEEG